MFRKIRSNRDPRDTLYSELKKEFQVYANKSNLLGKSFAVRYPRFLLGSMTLILIGSAIIAVWLHCKTLTPEKEKIRTQTGSLNDDFDHILAAGSALKQTIRLRRQVDSITAKYVLNGSDSLVLIRDLDSLQHIRLTLPH